MSNEKNANAPLSTMPKPFVFVLMPFDKDFDDIYSFGIKGAVEDAGGYAERLDEQIFTESMLERIFSQINKADVIVADMSTRNPNVFYEVGYAHALGKIVLLLTRDAADIPFDLRHHQHIVYGGKISDLRASLLSSLQWAIGQAMQASQQPDSPILMVSHGDEVLPQTSARRPKGSVILNRSHWRGYYCELNLVVQNTSASSTAEAAQVFLRTKPNPELKPASLGIKRERRRWREKRGYEGERRREDLIREEEFETPAANPLSSAKLPKESVSDELTECYQLPFTLDSLPPGGIGTLPLVLIVGRKYKNEPSDFCLRLQSVTSTKEYYFVIS